MNGETPAQPGGRRSPVSPNTMTEDTPAPETDGTASGIGDGVYVAAAHRLLGRGFHVFPLDHPDHPGCIGLHKPATPCDGARGKHPCVKWGTWAAAPTPKMVDLAWGQRNGLANIGVSCGPSNLVVLDEDAPGELDRWCVTYGIALPDTYTVATGRGAHLYFSWDHSGPDGRIGSSVKAVDGFKLDVRGSGCFVVAEGSQHACGAVYTGNDVPVAPLPAKAAELLLAATRSPGSDDAGHDGADRGHDEYISGFDERIPHGERHDRLVAYAGRLRKSALDRTEVLPAFKQRWLCCEQPEGQIPEAHFHSPDCPHPVTWAEAMAKLDDVFDRYAAGGGSPVEGMPRLWAATDLKGAEQPNWLAKNRLQRAAINLLIGDEGIGKSLLWVWIAAAVSTGTALPEFGIPAREPQHVVVVVTEDDWSTVVRPRLEVAHADPAMISVICTDQDGGGAPTFPRDLFLLAEATPAPALVVVDAWLDTVPAGLSVRDPQQARQALHPWKEIATATDAAVLLICHTNRVASANARDRYGATGELRKKARMTLYAQSDDEGKLIVGPEKMNTAAPIPATEFAITSVQHFARTADADGTVPLLTYIGESNRTAREHVAESCDAIEPGDREDRVTAKTWLREYIKLNGPQVQSAEAKRDGDKAGFSERTLQRARQELKVVYGWMGQPPKTTWSLPEDGDGGRGGGDGGGDDGEDGGDEEEDSVDAVPPPVSRGTAGTAGLVAGQDAVPRCANGTAWHTDDELREYTKPPGQDAVPAVPRGTPWHTGDDLRKRPAVPAVPRDTGDVAQRPLDFVESVQRFKERKQRRDHLGPPPTQCAKCYRAPAGGDGVCDFCAATRAPGGAR